MIRLRWLVAACAAVLSIAARPQTPEYRAQWADAFNSGYLSASQVTTMMSNLRTGHSNVVIPEIRVYADAYFAPTPSYYPDAGGTINTNGVRITADLASDPEPRKSSTYDALAEVLRQAHDTTGGKQRLDVWAWLVSFRTGATMRGLHPEWLTQKPDGTVVTTDFDPGHPGVEQQFYNVCMDLVDHYGIDGLHYDYIRFTASDNGFNPISVARFNARYGRTGVPSTTDTLFKQWRRDQITACVRKVYLNAIARKPALRMSAATISFAPGPTPPSSSDTNPLATWKTRFQATDAYASLYQDWRGWMEEGILDICIPMDYMGRCSYETAFENWASFTKENQFGRQGMIGPGVYLNTLADTMYQIDVTRGPSTPGGKTSVGQSLYSYAYPYADSCYGTSRNDPAGMASVLSTGRLPDGTVITTSPPYPTTTTLPDMPRLTNGKGHLKGTITDISCPAPGWVDAATVTIRGPVTRTAYSDGTGFYGFVDLTPGTYTVTVSSKNLVAQTQQINVTAGTVATLDFTLAPATVYSMSFTRQPGGAEAGKAFASQPVVTIQDAFGNTVTGYSGAVTLVLKSGTGATGAVLSGTTTVNAVSGVATFSGLSIDMPARGYVLTATALQVSDEDSVSFNVDMPVSQFDLQYSKSCTVVPGAAPTGYSGIAVNRNVGSPYYGYVYAAERLADHRVRIYRPNPASDGTAAVAYVDTGLRIKPVTASGTNPWDVAVGPDDTVWVMNLDARTIESAPPVPPSGTEVAAVQQIDVAALSGSGIGTSGPRGIAVRGPITDASVYLSLTGGGGGFFQKYSVQAANPASAGTASLVWSVPGSNLTYGVAVDPQGNSYWPISATGGSTTFTKLSPSGATIPFQASIPSFFTASLALGDADYVADASRPDGGYLALYSRTRSGTYSTSNPDHTSGHRFAMDGTWLDGFGPAMSGAPSQYLALSLVAASTSDTTGSSGSAQYFAVDDHGNFYGTYKDAYPGGNTAFAKVARLPQATLGFSVQPAGVRAGQVFDTQPAVVIRGMDGQVLNVAGPVTLSIKPGTGTTGASLFGTRTVNATGGAALFTDLGIDKSGTGYVLVASCSPLASVESDLFSVAQVPVALSFTTQPGTGTMGQPLPRQPVVTVLASDGTVATEYAGPVTLTLLPDSGTTGAILLGHATASVAAGIATFTDIAVDTPGSNYVLVADSGALVQATSDLFDVNQAAYALADAAQALRCAGGLVPAQARDRVRLDALPDASVDLRDALRIARKAAGLEANP